MGDQQDTRLAEVALVEPELLEQTVLLALTHQRITHHRDTAEAAVLQIPRVRAAPVLLVVIREVEVVVAVPGPRREEAGATEQTGKWSLSPTSENAIR